MVYFSDMDMVLSLHFSKCLFVVFLRCKNHVDRSFIGVFRLLH